MKRKTLLDRAGTNLKRTYGLPNKGNDDGLRELWFLTGFQAGWRAARRSRKGKRHG